MGWAAASLCLRVCTDLVTATLAALLIGAVLSKAEHPQLGVLLCDLEPGTMASDPNILDKLKRCPALTGAQQDALNALLLSGHTEHGDPSSWDLQTLQDLGPLVLALNQSTLSLVAEAAREDFRSIAATSIIQGHSQRDKSLLPLVAGTASRPRLKRSSDRCQSEPITASNIPDILTLSLDQLDPCLSNDVLIENLEAVLEQPITSEISQILKKKVDEVFHSEIPEEQLRRLGELSHLYTEQEISQWSVTSSDTLSALLSASGRQWNDSQVLQLLSRYLALKGSLTGPLLQKTGGKLLCKLQEEQIQQIPAAAIGTAGYLNISTCSQTKKEQLYGKAREAFASLTSSPSSYYCWIQPYLGGAPAEDLKELANAGVAINMDLDTFLALNPEELQKLSVTDVKHLLGKNLPVLKKAELEPSVMSWVQKQFQQELDCVLGIGLQGGRPEPTGTASPAGHTTPASVTSAVTATTPVPTTPASVTSAVTATTPVPTTPASVTSAVTATTPVPTTPASVTSAVTATTPVPTTSASVTTPVPTTLATVTTPASVTSTVTATSPVPTTPASVTSMATVTTPASVTSPVPTIPASVTSMATVTTPATVTSPVPTIPASVTSMVTVPTSPHPATSANVTPVSTTLPTVPTTSASVTSITPVSTPIAISSHSTPQPSTVPPRTPTLSTVSPTAPDTPPHSGGPPVPPVPTATPTARPAVTTAPPCPTQQTGRATSPTVPLLSTLLATSSPSATPVPAVTSRATTGAGTNLAGTTHSTVTPVPNLTSSVTVTPVPNPSSSPTVTPVPNLTSSVTVTPVPNPRSSPTVTPVPHSSSPTVTSVPSPSSVPTATPGPHSPSAPAATTTPHTPTPIPNSTISTQKPLSSSTAKPVPEPCQPSSPPGSPKPKTTPGSVPETPRPTSNGYINLQPEPGSGCRLCSCLVPVLAATTMNVLLL